VLHPDQLGRGLTASQWAEWQAWHATEPHGEARDDWRFAWLVKQILGLMSKRDPTADPLRVADVVADLRREMRAEAVKPPVTDEEIEAMLEARSEALWNKVTRGMDRIQ